jgi:hypothetical protein
MRISSGRGCVATGSFLFDGPLLDPQICKRSIGIALRVVLKTGEAACSSRFPSFDIPILLFLPRHRQTSLTSSNCMTKGLTISTTVAMEAPCALIVQIALVGSVPMNVPNEMISIPCSAKAPEIRAIVPG